MSWDSVFRNVANVIKLITMIGPIIDFLEALFSRWFPKAKMGTTKKKLALKMAKEVLSDSIPEETLSEFIDGYVEAKNSAKEYTHWEERTTIHGA